MSKRASDGFGGDEERYGSQIQYQKTMTATDDPPTKATAAQLARRKIAQMKKPGRGRSGSPAVAPQADGGFGGGNAFAQSQPQQQAPNPFQASNFNFSFGQPQQQQQQENGGAFQFGMSAPASSQQNGPGSMFGQSQSAAPSFGSFNNAASTQPSTNGFNPSTTSIFTQPPQTNSTPSFGGFGATQQNGTPATSTSSTFGSFGQNQNSAQNGTQGSTNGFLFGSVAQAPEEKEKAPASKNPFAGISMTQPEAEKPKTTFGGFGASQQEKEKSSTPFSGFGTAQQEKPKKSTPAIFGAPQQDTSRASTPFGGFGATQPEKPGNLFNFGQEPTESADKPSTPFGQSQANGDKPGNLFSGLGQKPAETGERANTPFAGFGQNQTTKPTDTQNTPSFGFGQANGDKSTTSQEKVQPAAQSNIFGGPETNGASAPAEPKKPLFAFGQTQATPKADQPANMFSQSVQVNGEKKGLFGASIAPFSTPSGTGSVFDNLPRKDLSNGGKPLFSSADPAQIYRPEQDEDEDANGEGTTSITNAFGQSQQKPSIFASTQTTQPTPKPASNLFSSAGTSQQDVSMTTPSTNKNLFGSANQENASSTTPAPARSLFDRVDKEDVAKRLSQDTSNDAEAPRASLFNIASENPATAKPLFTTSVGTSSLFQKPASQPPTTAPPAATAPVSFKPLPAPAPAAQPVPTPSETPMLASAESSSNLTTSQKTKLAQLNQGLISHLSDEDPEKDWTVICQYYMRMASQISGASVPAEADVHRGSASQASNSNNLFARASAASTSTAQTPKQPAATDLFSKPPSTAPPAAKKRPFELDEESATQTPATEKRSKPNEPVSYPKLPENASSTSRLFAAALDKSKSTETPKSAAPSIFTPSTKPLFSASQAQTAATGGFKPTSSTSAAAGSNFLASFGKVAKENEEKERKKRKANDYDSDDETEEAWEKRDREEQEAKRAKLAEAAKSATGFSFTGSSEAPKTPSFKLGASSAASTTPAVPPPKFNNLFGTTPKQSAVSSTSEAGKLAPPTGFGFGPASSSVEASRATTPGVTTDGEASNAAEEAGEPSDEPNMEQVDDQTALQPAEREANEILQEIPNALTRKFAKKEGEEKSSFQTQGEGRVYVLKDKTTGKTRILSRVGMGKLVLNFNPMKNFSYIVHTKKPNLVVCDFIDHIGHTPPKMDRFYITTGNADEAKELARLLTEGTPK